MFVAGGIVTGENFFGREVELDRLKVFFSGINNYSVTGLSRIGKSSLVSELLIRMSEVIASDNIQIIKFSLNSNTQEKTIFRQLFKKILDATKHLESDDLKNEAEAVIDELDNEYIDEKKVIELSDKLFSETGIRFFLIIDEFDKAPDVFSKHLMTLREIITHSKNIKLLTISRTSLGKLFPLGANGSVFPGAFVSYPLKGFSVDDVKIFKQNLQQTVENGVNRNIWEKIEYYAGNSPFCLALWCNAYLDVIRNHSIEIDEDFIIEEIEEICVPQTDEFLSYQCQALKRLGELDNLKTFLHTMTLERQDIDIEKFRNLQSYGVIRRSNRSLTQPYLKDYLSKIPDTNIDPSELSQLVPIINKLIDDCELKLTTLFGAGHSATRISSDLTQYRRDLQAIKIKLDSEIELSNLDAFLLPDISDVEINLYKQKIFECRNYLNRV